MAFLNKLINLFTKYNSLIIWKIEIKKAKNIECEREVQYNLLCTTVLGVEA
jgi:hypothetical protein